MGRHYSDEEYESRRHRDKERDKKIKKRKKEHYENLI